MLVLDLLHRAHRAVHSVRAHVYLHVNMYNLYLSHYTGFVQMSNSQLI